ncbi:hypothetical protein KGV55_03075 [Candidatus Gracilibacteria bacterium]|nr:hypothetical protein [Candidatus Gracilibacteria bacterium]
MNSPKTHTSLSHSFGGEKVSYREIDDMTTLEKIELGLSLLEKFGSHFFSLNYLINKAKEEKVAPEVLEEIEKRYTYLIQNKTLNKINNAMSWLESTKKDVFQVKEKLDEAEQEKLLAPEVIHSLRKQYEEIINMSQK